MSDKQLSDKDLAIKLAERMGNTDFKGGIEYLEKKNRSTDMYINVDQYISDYLEQKAKEILFKEGVSQNIDSYLMNKRMERAKFWSGSDTNGTLSPRKVIEVYLSMEDE